jgi:hypothetical protein
MVPVRIQGGVLMMHAIRKLRSAASVLCAGGLILFLGCEGLPEDEILTVESTGAVEGFAYLDADGSGAFENRDEPVAGLEVRLVFPGTQQVVASALADEEGLYQIDAVPVGTFEVEIGSSVLADSLLVVDLDPAAVTVATDSVVSISVGVSFPAVTLTAARTLPLGKKVFVEGITLNALGTFSDGAIHLADSSGYIRATNVSLANIFPGDSVRFLGRIDRENGWPVLDGATPFVLQPLVGLPDPVELSTLDAAGASEGTLDAANVSVRQAIIMDTTSVDDGFRLTVDDGTGPLAVFLDAVIPFDRDPLVPEAVITRARGLLVPEVGGVRWELKPRFPVDLDVVPPPAGLP